MDWERLVEIIDLLSPRRISDRTLPPLLLLIDLFKLFLLLCLLCSGLQVGPAVHASRDHLGVVGDSLVRSHVFFVNEVIGCCDRVVTVRLDALHRVFVVKAMLFLHHLEYRLIERHFFFAWEKSTYSFLFGKFEPGMTTDVIDRVTGVRISVQYLS